MIRAIALWLLRFLEQSLDTDLKQRLADYQAERARTEESIRREKAALEGDARMLAALREQRAGVQLDTKNTEAELATLKEEVRKIDSEKTNTLVADGDALRDRL